jgi:hypothetical protein
MAGFPIHSWVVWNDMGWNGRKLLKFDYGNKTDNTLLTYLCSSPDNKLVQPVKSDFLAVSGRGGVAGRSAFFNGLEKK